MLKRGPVSVWEHNQEALSQPPYALGELLKFDMGVSLTPGKEEGGSG